MDPDINAMMAGVCQALASKAAGEHQADRARLVQQHEAEKADWLHERQRLEEEVRSLAAVQTQKQNVPLGPLTARSATSSTTTTSSSRSHSRSPRKHTPTSSSITGNGSDPSLVAENKQLKRELKNLKSLHTRLEKKYDALFKNSEARIAQHEDDKDMWREFKKSLKLAMKGNNEFRLAFKSAQEEIVGSQGVTSSQNPSEQQEERENLVPAPVVTATKGTRINAGTSSAATTPTKRAEKMKSVLMSKPIRTPTKFPSASTSSRSTSTSTSKTKSTNTTPIHRDNRPGTPTTAKSKPLFAISPSAANAFNAQAQARLRIEQDVNQRTPPATRPSTKTVFYDGPPSSDSLYNYNVAQAEEQGEEEESLQPPSSVVRHAVEEEEAEELKGPYATNVRSETIHFPMQPPADFSPPCSSDQLDSLASSQTYYDDRVAEAEKEAQQTRIQQEQQEWEARMAEENETTESLTVEQTSNPVHPATVAAARHETEHGDRLDHDDHTDADVESSEEGDQNAENEEEHPLKEKRDRRAFQSSQRAEKLSGYKADRAAKAHRDQSRNALLPLTLLSSAVVPAPVASASAIAHSGSGSIPLLFPLPSTVHFRPPADQDVWDESLPRRRGQGVGQEPIEQKRYRAGADSGLQPPEDPRLVDPDEAWKPYGGVKWYEPTAHSQHQPKMPRANASSRAAALSLLQDESQARRSMELHSRRSQDQNNHAEEPSALRNATAVEEKGKELETRSVIVIGAEVAPIAAEKQRNVEEATRDNHSNNSEADDDEATEASSSSPRKLSPGGSGSKRTSSGESFSPSTIVRSEEADVRKKLDKASRVTTTSDTVQEEDGEEAREEEEHFTTRSKQQSSTSLRTSIQRRVSFSNSPVIVSIYEPSIAQNPRRASTSSAARAFRTSSSYGPSKLFDPGAFGNSKQLSEDKIDADARESRRKARSVPASSQRPPVATASAKSATATQAALLDRILQGGDREAIPVADNNIGGSRHKSTAGQPAPEHLSSKSTTPVPAGTNAKEGTPAWLNLSSKRNRGRAESPASTPGATSSTAGRTGGVAATSSSKRSKVGTAAFASRVQALKQDGKNAGLQMDTPTQQQASRRPLVDSGHGASGGILPVSLSKDRVRSAPTAERDALGDVFTESAMGSLSRQAYTKPTSTSTNLSSSSMPIRRGGKIENMVPKSTAAGAAIFKKAVSRPISASTASSTQSSSSMPIKAAGKPSKAAAGASTRQTNVSTPTTAPGQAKATASGLKLTTSSSTSTTAIKRKRLPGAIPLPEDIEDDLDTVGKAIVKGRKDPVADDSQEKFATMISRKKQLDIERALEAAHLKRNMQAINRSKAMDEQLRQPPQAEASKTSEMKAQIEGRADTVHGDEEAQESQSSDTSEEFAGQEFMRNIHKKRRLEMQEDPMKHKGKGQYARQMPPNASDARALEINPDQNNGQNYQYHEVIRNRDARKQMHGVDCDCCKGYYEAAVSHLPLEQRREAAEELAQRNSRHREQWEAPPTPPNYWQMGFPSSAQVDRINEEAREMEKAKRAKMEAEANKCDGRYRYKPV